MKRILSVFVCTILIVLSLRAHEPSDTIGCNQKFKFVPAITNAAMGFGLNAGVTELMKRAVFELRPDRSDYESFPSRHASYAFNIGSIISYGLYGYSPFWVSGAHIIADGVAMQRVLNSRHFPSDVLAGAAIGIASNEAAHAIGRAIFKSKNHCYFDAENLSSLTVSTVALIPLSSRGEGLSAGCGVESSMTLSVAMDSWWGYGVSLRLRSQPIYVNDVYSDAMNSVGLSAMCYLFKPVFDGQWALGVNVSGGPTRNFDRPLNCVESWSAILNASMSLSKQVSRKLSIGGEIGCDITERPGPNTNLLIALITKAYF